MKPHVSSRAYGYWLVALLLVINIFNSVDRQIIGLLGESIKHDLDLADWQLGLLTGLAFALLYTILGIPIARLSDRYHRGRIIAACLALWSAFTALSGLAQTFVQLALMRVGVGIGEAGVNPAAHSLISDYIPRHRRAAALSIYTMGLPLGILVGMGLGGIVAQSWGWRSTMIVAGLPGIALSLVALLCLKDRRSSLSIITQAQPVPSLGDGLRAFRNTPTYWRIAGAMTCLAFTQSAIQTFAVPLFLREHSDGIQYLAAALSSSTGLTLKPLGAIGLAFGLIMGLAGAGGMLLGAAFASWFGRTDERGMLLMPAIAGLIAIPSLVLTCFSMTMPVALFFLGLAVLLMLLPTGPAFATIQSISPVQLRATAVAVLMFIMNLFGAAMGPLVAGAISDLLVRHVGLTAGEGLRYALAIQSLPLLISAVVFWAARRDLLADIRG